MKSFFCAIVLSTILLVQSAAAARPPQEADSEPHWLRLHTRLKIASPNQSYYLLEEYDYRQLSYRNINAGVGLKLQMFSSIYGEYTVLTNLNRQTSNQLMAGIETPTPGIRFGLRYMFTGKWFTPSFEQRNRDLQMYVHLGGARGGLEIALGSLNRIISGDDLSAFDILDLSDVKVTLSAGLWSTR